MPVQGFQSLERQVQLFHVDATGMVRRIHHLHRGELNARSTHCWSLAWLPSIVNMYVLTPSATPGGHSSVSPGSLTKRGGSGGSLLPAAFTRHVYHGLRPWSGLGSSSTRGFLLVLAAT